VKQNIFYDYCRRCRTSIGYIMSFSHFDLEDDEAYTEVWDLMEGVDEEFFDEEYATTREEGENWEQEVL
jgi:hypothetical protein